MIVKDKVVLVTGASEGIGLEVAKKIAESGAKVIGVSRNIESGKFESNFEKVNCDVSRVSDIKNLVDHIKEKYGQLDAVINNAGIWQKLSGLEDVADARIDELIDTNLKGVLFLTKYTMSLLKKQPEALLVNIVSRSGVIAQAGQSVYTASKYGVRGFTDVLREDLKDSNVHVMAVFQAGTNTQMFKKAGDDFPVEKFTEASDLASQIVNAINSPTKLWVNELHVNYR